MVELATLVVEVIDHNLPAKILGGQGGLWIAMYDAIGLLVLDLVRGKC